MSVRRVVAASVLLVLAGCSDDPPVPPPLTPATSASTPAGLVEPTLPAAAARPDAAGATAFAEFYWEMATYAQASGDADALRELGAATCEACAAGADAVADIYSSGGTIIGGAYTPTVRAVAKLGANVVTYRVRVDLVVAPQVIDYPAPKKDASDPGGVNRARMFLNFLDGKWVVAVWEPL